MKSCALPWFTSACCAMVLGWGSQSIQDINSFSVNPHLTSLAESFLLWSSLGYRTQAGMASVLEGVKAPGCWTMQRPWTWESPRAGSCPTLATNYVPLDKIFNILMSQKSPGFLTTHTEKVKAVRKKKTTCFTEFISVLQYNTLFLKLQVRPFGRIRYQFRGS